MQKNLNIEKIIFKVVQIKFLAMHILIISGKNIVMGMILISNDF